MQGDPAAAESLREGVGEDLKHALEERQELARGLHPAIHTHRGHVIRAIAETAAGARHRAPDKLVSAPFDGWIAENRLWALSASLQSLMRGGRLSRDVVADPDHNLLRHLIWPR